MMVDLEMSEVECHPTLFKRKVHVTEESVRLQRLGIDPSNLELCLQ